jgi:hypothetical protein
MTIGRNGEKPGTMPKWNWNLRTVLALGCCVIWDVWGIQQWNAKDGARRIPSECGATTAVNHSA